MKIIDNADLCIAFGVCILLIGIVLGSTAVSNLAFVGMIIGTGIQVTGVSMIWYSQKLYAK